MREEEIWEDVRAQIASFSPRRSRGFNIRVLATSYLTKDFVYEKVKGEEARWSGDGKR